MGTEDEAVQAQTLVGTVLEPLPNALFRVSLENGHKILAHGSGGVRDNHLRLLAGDRVRIEVAPTNPTRGRIVERLK
ncbi:MAG TPA: translation initiation factor IF-1 [Candidatus Dormibacteraeota bacterium]|nr:translation initiation factor IF-1 [Candidatus Dormibacteraeota bacterium]